jgi:protein-S-isoprenylcysteine O-methyltransferase Ste14
MNNLLAKAISGFLTLAIILGACLFISAGTFNYWQAWLYLGVFLSCTIFITVYLFRYDQKLLSSRVQSGPTAETQKSQKIIQSLASLAFIGMLVLPGLDQRFQWSRVPNWLVLLSAIMVSLGFYCVFLVFRENSFTSAIIEVANDQRVIESGPYRVVRHPMYAGAGVLVMFTPIALGSWLGILCSMMLMVVIAIRSIEEEKYLSNNLEGYSAYQQKVRYRLIPRVW